MKVLPHTKTTAYSLPTMDHDQSTVQGNKDILQTVVEVGLGLEQTQFKSGTRIIIAGDQLTVSRLRSLKEYCWDDISSYHTMEWVVPVMQLFHMQMLLASLIFRTHYGQLSTPGSLAYNVAMLGRKRVSLDKPDFHAVDELLRHTFDAMVLTVFQEVLATENLEKFVKGHSRRTVSERTMAALTTIMERYFDASLDEFNGTASQNASLFLRDMLFYIELCSAIKAGDVGRIKEVLKWITVIFQCGMTRNYANEILHLHCGLSYSWSTKTREAVESSWLVNTTGQPNRFIPADLYQEHNNRMIKESHLSSGSASWEYSERAMSINIRSYQHIKSVVEEQYQISYSGTGHKKSPAILNIQRIVRSLKENQILSKEPRSCQKLSIIDPVTDLLTQGLTNLSEGGRIQNFKGIARDYCTLLDREVNPNHIDDDLCFDIEQHLLLTSNDLDGFN